MSPRSSTTTTIKKFLPFRPDIRISDKSIAPTLHPHDQLKMLKLSPSSTSPRPILPCQSNHDPRRLHAQTLKTGTFLNPLTSTRILSLYVDPKVNNLEYARDVFNSMDSPDLLTWNIIIKAYVVNHLSNTAIALFRELLHHFVPDNFTVPCVIKGCAKLNAMREGRQIHGLVLKIGLGLDKYVQSSLVSMYSKCGEIDSAKKVFNEMTDKDLVSWNSLIDGYVRCGEIEHALELFDEMPERDCFSWTALVDGFSKCGEIGIARDIFDRMPTRNLVSWNAMINGYMKSGDCDNAVQLFNQMETRDRITWNSMIAGFESNEKYKEALDIFRRMIVDGFVPNQATLVSSLSAASGSASLSMGKLIHSHIVKKGEEIDGVLGTCLIDMYSRCGNINNSLSIFRSITNMKLGHWTAIIGGLGLHGMANEALHLFSEMRNSGVKPDAVTFIGVLNACNHAGLVDHGRYYFEVMKKDYGIEPTVEHFGCLVDLLCRGGHINAAKKVVDSMPMTPNKLIWMSLLSGARIKGNLTVGEYAANRLIELAPETIGGYVVLSNMYAAAGQWNKVAEVREMMKSKGIRKDPGCSSIEHKGHVHEFTVADTSHTQKTEIYSKMTEMRDRLKSAGHVPDTTQVLLHIEGKKEKEAELETHSERLAIAFGLIHVAPESPIRIMKNLRVCNDCHTVTKLLSGIYHREIIVRDNTRFHHFKDGSCSCNDFW